MGRVYILCILKQRLISLNLLISNVDCKAAYLQSQSCTRVLLILTVHVNPAKGTILIPPQLAPFLVKNYVKEETEFLKSAKLLYLILNKGVCI